MPAANVTALLRKWGEGDRTAAEQIAEIVYADLRRQARNFLKREHDGHSLHSAELVNEAYLRLVDQKGARWQDRAHFFALAGKIMRQILVDHARARLRDKRGGGVPVLLLNEAIDLPEQRSLELLALDDALNALARLDPQQGKVVELRFFAGLSAEETAAALGISRSTVMRDWVTARAWLLRELRSGGTVAHTPASTFRNS
jgi:RNA polymerase sigma factor (TIGR02999 family)